MKTIAGVFIGVIFAFIALFLFVVIVAAKGRSSAAAFEKINADIRAASVQNLEVENINFVVDGNYMHVTGSVRNKGANPVSSVKVAAKYVDKKKTVVDTDWTYAVSGHALGPGEARSFDMMTPTNRAAKQVAVDIVTD